MSSSMPQMREKLHFQRRSLVDDGYGNVESGDWVTVFTAAADVIPLRGSEAVMASRLGGVQPCIIKIWSHADARTVTAGWRAVDARKATKIFNIRSIANFDLEDVYLDIMAESGVVT